MNSDQAKLETIMEKDKLDKELIRVLVDAGTPVDKAIKFILSGGLI